MGRKMIRCVHCRRVFQADPRVRNQRYCGAKPCQRARKNNWQQRKIADDSEYQADKRDSQRAWQEKNPDYWKRYRHNNPEYVERNRRLQRERDRRRRDSIGRKADILAKKDALKDFFNVDSGRYFILSGVDTLAKKNAIMVKISPISTS